MKLFKFIFKLIMFLLLITVVGTIIFGFASYDYSGPKFDNQNLNKYPTMTDEINSSFKTSLKSIKDNNYDEAHNIVTFSFKGNQDTGFESINREIVEHIELQNGYIYDGGGYKIRNVLICPYHDGDYNISLKIDAEAIGFYRTQAKLIGKAKYENGSIIATFDKYSLGPVPVLKFIAESLPVDQIKFSDGNFFSIYKNEKGINCKINLESLLASKVVADANSVIFKVLGLEKTVEFNETSLDVKINTKGIFSVLNPISNLLG